MYLLSNMAILGYLYVSILFFWGGPELFERVCIYIYIHTYIYIYICVVNTYVYIFI